MPRGDLGIYALGNSSEEEKSEERASGRRFRPFPHRPKISFLLSDNADFRRMDGPTTDAVSDCPSVRSDVEHEFPLLV